MSTRLVSPIATLILGLIVPPCAVAESPEGPGIVFQDELEEPSWAVSGAGEPPACPAAVDERSAARDSIGSAEQVDIVFDRTPDPDLILATAEQEGGWFDGPDADPPAAPGDVDRWSQSDGREQTTLEPAASDLARVSFAKVFQQPELLREAKAKVDRPSQVTNPPCRDPYFGFEQATAFCWEPSNLAHKTLYFDDPLLERYGYTCSPLLQPALSLTEFYKDLLAAPIRGIFDGAAKCHFVAGRARVGSCAGHVKERIVPGDCR